MFFSIGGAFSLLYEGSPFLCYLFWRAPYIILVYTFDIWRGGTMMNNRERENVTLSFQKPEGRGAVQETFYPWTLTVERWKEEGLPASLVDHLFTVEGRRIGEEELYLNTLMADGVSSYEAYLGFDMVKRVTFNLPFSHFERKDLEETEEYIIRQDGDGWQRKYYKNRDLVQEHKPVVASREDWYALKEHGKMELEKYYTDENILRIYSPYREGHQRGDYSIRLNIMGFFWTPRTLFGIEEHMFAFYDYPDIMHDMNEFILQIYLDRLGKVLDILPADVVYIQEDLSGVNGPMLSADHFNEFVGDYYRRLVPFLKGKGVRHIFVDTDGDFNALIPHFMDAGIEGFLPMDVNAGMDIVAVREMYPTLKFIGGFNKLEIAKGRDAIDAEFERLMPVIRQGGYIPGCDHQVAPSTSLEDYRYYIRRLKEVMHEAGRDVTK